MIPQQDDREAWLEWRKDKVGASEAPTLMGDSPWETEYQLWQRKLELIPEKEQSPQMKRGLHLEEEARKVVSKLIGIPLIPCVMIHPAYEWMIASLDGWNEKTKTVVEIKCPGESDHQCAMNGEIPKKYLYQLCHQAIVCGVDTVNYFSYDGMSYNYIPFTPSEYMIQRLIMKELEFLECMRNFIAPPLTDRDYQSLEGDLECQSLIEQWKNATCLMNSYAELEKKLRSSLIEKTNGRNSQGYGVKLSKVTRMGNVNYKDVPQLKGVDLNPYRGKPTTYWKISGGKDE